MQYMDDHISELDEVEEFGALIDPDQKGSKIYTTLILTILQKDQLREAIEKIKDDYQPIYQVFYKLTEEGSNSKPEIPMPVSDAKYNLDMDVEEVECSSCLCTVFKPVYC